jgi:lipoprotein-releasing system permease protein
LRPYELFVGLRYTRAKRRTHFISFISAVSMLGIALGIAALITVISVMNGFEKEIRARILGAAAHIQVQGLNNAPLDNWEAVAGTAKKHPEVLGAAPFVQAQGLLSTGSTVRGVYVRGIVPELEDQVADFSKHMRSGGLSALQPGGFGIVVGVGVARALGLHVGDRVTLISPQGQVTPAGLMPRLKQFTVVGIFALDHNEYDSALALTRMEDAQLLYRMDGAVTGVRLKVRDVDRAPAVAQELYKSLPDTSIYDWTLQNVNYFRAVQIEKRMMFIILTLIIAVAAFNLVSTLVMVVTDKHPDIAILRTLGASPGSIMKIFVVQGAVIGSIGTLAGVLVGVLLASNIDVVVPFIERTFNFQILSREVYYISELPSDLRWPDVIWVAAVSLALAFVATIYPSWRASRVNPAEALRYE